MKRDNLPWRAVQSAALHWHETGAPVSATYDDVYYSQDNGLEESRHVFLNGNDLPARWLCHPRPHFCIGELGFGTGLNFLLTWRAWRELSGTRQSGTRPDLHYLALEKHPLTCADLARALAQWPALAELAEPLLQAYPGPLPGQHRVLLEGGRVRLDLWWEDAGQSLADLAGRGQPLVDAWYLDGFAPSRNETMWTHPVLTAAAALSQPGASCATFTVAGQVRRHLTDAGFSVAKVPGYGRKRECLRGVIADPPVSGATPDLVPWDLPAAACERPDSALVVGGGLAGCAVAAALAQRGIAVTLLEAGELAAAGSGNDQGILYTRLSRKHSALTDFALQSFQFASAFYRQLFQAGRLIAPLDGELCGSFAQHDNASDLAAMRDALTGLEDLAQVLDAPHASAVLGVAQPSAGYWYPGSGWLRPAAVCGALLEGENIHVIQHCGEVALCLEDGQWHAMAGGQALARAACAVVAAGTGTTAMSQFTWLPLQTVRGQVTQLPAAAPFDELRTVLCHEGYIAPARNGVHSVGATFEVNSDTPLPRVSANRGNLAKLAEAVPAWRAALAAFAPEALDGRAGYRSTSPDYLPVLGPVPDVAAFHRDYGALRKNARQRIDTRGSYLPGLYVSAAHGSRGLTSTPLAAELLASMICGEPPPLSRALCRALAPARFIIRDLSRNRS
jgi:tRNA 5-methylaminomethyl-2-thiouridine biosynthesis bifunctional protein